MPLVDINKELRDLDAQREATAIKTEDALEEYIKSQGTPQEPMWKSIWEAFAGKEKLQNEMRLQLLKSRGAGKSLVVLLTCL